MNSKLTLAQQSLVAEVVDSAVKKFFPGNPMQACAWYAFLGMMAANKLVGTGKPYYHLIAGSFRMFIAPDPGDNKGAWSFDMIAHDIPELKENSISVYSASPDAPMQFEFHAWFGVIDFERAEYVEVVDLASQHYQDWVQAARLPWMRPPVPKTLWTDHAGLEALRVQLYPLPALEREILECLLAQDELHQALAFVYGSV